MSALDVSLLRCLRTSGRHLLLEETAELVQTTVSEVEQTIAGLQTAGFEIENKPGFGCRLIASPDRLIADDLLSRLIAPCSIAREIVVFEETASTNDIAMRMGREGHPGNVVVFAERQTAGRGRFSRRWESAAHVGLWFSILLHPSLPLEHWPRLTTATGVAIAKALSETNDLSPTLKWPNDVLLGGRKVAGILIETSTDEAGRPFAVIGVGVNVNQTDFPEEITTRATSLAKELGHSVDRPQLAADILRSIDHHLKMTGGDFEKIIASASHMSALLGNWIQLQQGDSLLEGEAESLNAEGNLILRQADGTRRTVIAGEVTSQLSGI